MVPELVVRRDRRSQRRNSLNHQWIGIDQIQVQAILCDLRLRNYLEGHLNSPSIASPD
jgi:hypothetical protein